MTQVSAHPGRSPLISPTIRKIAATLLNCLYWLTIAIVVILAGLKFVLSSSQLLSPIATAAANRVASQLSTMLDRPVSIRTGQLGLSIGTSGVYAHIQETSLQVGDKALTIASANFGLQWNSTPVIHIKGSEIDVEYLPEDNSFVIAGIPLSNLEMAMAKTNRIPFLLPVVFLASETKILHHDPDSNKVNIYRVDLNLRPHFVEQWLEINLRATHEQSKFQIEGQSRIYPTADGIQQANFYAHLTGHPADLVVHPDLNLNADLLTDTTIWGRWQDNRLTGVIVAEVAQGKISYGSTQAAARKFEAKLRFSFTATDPHATLIGRWRADTTGLDLSVAQQYLNDRLQLDRIEASGELRWTPASWQVSLADMRFQSADVAGAVELELAGSGTSLSTFNITGQAPRFTYSWLTHLLPEELLGGRALNFLREDLAIGTSVLQTVVARGHPLAEDSWPNGANDAFRLIIDFKDASLNYLDGWPPIVDGVGRIDLHGKRLLVKVAASKITNGTNSSAQVAIDDLSASPATLYAAVKTDFTNRALLNLLRVLPPTKKRMSELAQLTLVGKQAMTLRLAIPLDNEDPLGVDGNIAVANNLVIWQQPLAVTISQINGDFTFDSTGLQGLAKGLVLGEKIRLEMEVTEEDGTFGLSGKFDIAAVLAKLSRELDLPLVGRSRVSLAASSDGIKLSSDLQGTAIALPAPLGKKASTKRLAIVHFSPGSFSLDYDSGLVQVASNGVGTEILLGGGPPPFAPDFEGLQVHGSLTGLILDEILVSNSGNTIPHPAEFRLSLKQAKIMDLNLPTLQLSITVAATTTVAAFEAAAALGTVSIDDNGLIKANLDRLILPAKEQADHTPEETASTPGKASGILPPLDLSIRSLALGKKRFSNLVVAGSPIDDTWILEQARAETNGNVIVFRGNTKMQGTPQTNLSLQLSLTSIENFLVDMGIPTSSLSGGSGLLDGNITWQGAISEPHYPSLDGNLSLSFANFNLIKADSQGLQLLRLISPFDILGNIFESNIKGLNFDQAQGLLHLKNGQINFDQLQLDGADLLIKVGGSTDLVTERHAVHGSLQAKKSNSIAIISFAAVNPIISGALLVFDKVLNSPLLPPFKVNYEVHGTWQEPQFELLKNADSTKKKKP